MLPKSNNNRLVSYSLRYDWNSVLIVTNYFLWNVFLTSNKRVNSFEFVVLLNAMKSYNI